MPSPERENTDDSLRTERKNTDDALKGDRASTASDADDVVERARAVADEVLSAARREADHQSTQPPRPVEAASAVDERATADRALQREHATADGVVRSDRQERADLLDSLLVHERQATDAYLLTERARADDAVEHRDDFLGMVAHDVRNLLNGIVLSLGLLRSAGGEDDPDSPVSAAASRILRYVARMNRLIGDLVDVTSIDAGKLAMAPREGDAAALMAEATEAFQSAALEKGVSLSAEVPAGPLLAQFDHGRILQVFANLIANAIKFTARGGSIRVRVEVAPETLRFCISDTGVGIPAPMLRAIFERFWQVGENDQRGQGLGLYIAKSIVVAHGGRIWAESTVGKGSQLHFTLPLPGPRPVATPARSRTRDRERPQSRSKGKSDRRR